MAFSIRKSDTVTARLHKIHQTNTPAIKSNKTSVEDKLDVNVAGNNIETSAVDNIETSAVNNIETNAVDEIDGEAEMMITRITETIEEATDAILDDILNKDTATHTEEYMNALSEKFDESFKVTIAIFASSIGFVNYWVGILNVTVKPDENESVQYLLQKGADPQKLYMMYIKDNAKFTKVHNKIHEIIQSEVKSNKEMLQLLNLDIVEPVEPIETKATEKLNLIDFIKKI